MTYKLTEVHAVTNAGTATSVHIFDTFDELQDYMTEATANMTEDEAELYHYYAKIEELA